MSLTAKMLLLFVLLVFPAVENVRSDTDIHGKLFGAGVCTVSRKDTKQVPTLRIRFYPEMGYSLCWQFPPWCKTPTGRELKEFVTAPENIKHEILSLKCCPGYYPSRDDTSCLPICSKHCLSDRCLSPNNCSVCQTGYHGPTCIQDTPANGTTVSPAPLDCQCPNENFMCTNELKCVCVEGFDGPSCQHIIPSPIIVDPDNSCWFYVEKVGVLVMGLAASAILIAILLKKRVCWSIPFEPLDDRNVPVV